MSELKLSICVPTFNRCDILFETFSHLHKECDQEITQIVVSDNHSDDNTENIINDFYKKFKHFKKLKPSKPISPEDHAIFLLRSADAKYSYLLGDDDEIYFESLKKAVAIMDANNDLAAVYGSYQEWDRTNNKILGTSRHVSEIEIFSDPLSILNRFTLLWHPVSRTKTALRHFLYGSAGFDFWPQIFRYLQFGKIAIIPDILYKHAHTVPRMEFNLTESWYHDSYRGMFEEYIASLGQPDASQLGNINQFISRITSSAYLQGIRFSIIKKDYLKLRHFILRSRAAGVISEEEISRLESEYLLDITAAKAIKLITYNDQFKNLVVEDYPIMREFINKIENLKVPVVFMKSEEFNQNKQKETLFISYKFNPEFQARMQQQTDCLDNWGSYVSLEDFINSAKISNCKYI